LIGRKKRKKMEEDLLHEKLNRVIFSKLEGEWTSEKIISQISKENLKEILPIFPTLKTQLKTSLLLSFISLNNKLLNNLNEEITAIIKVFIII
jgi:IS30 family transposase